MISRFFGIEYGHGACAVPQDGGPALAPSAVQKMFPDAEWNFVTPPHVDIATCMIDRFGENAPVQKMIYDGTPNVRHIMIGGDHSVNFGHFAALADRMPNEDLCLVYIDAHFDIHNPESSRAQATGSPHGCNVRGLLGDGDNRWMGLVQHKPSLKPENVFFIGIRSFEPAEIEFVNEQNIFVRFAHQLTDMNAVYDTVDTVRKKIANRPFVLSFDFDSIDPTFFPDVLVPEKNGITVEAAKYMVTHFRDATSFEFVEYAPNGDKQSCDVVQQLISVIVNQ
ncbi:MAG: arginase family protein [Alphaproteobacteria bacterium]|nr:arginase family protein [Alphaproteobacteria bacterium]